MVFPGSCIIFLSVRQPSSCFAWPGFVWKGSFCIQEYQKKTLNPVWNEDKWLLVQEPKTQAMRVQMFDHDILNIKVPNAKSSLQEYKQWSQLVAWSLCAVVLVMPFSCIYVLYGLASAHSCT